MSRAMGVLVSRDEGPHATAAPAEPLAARCHAGVNRVLPWCVATAVLAALAGSAIGLVLAPEDFLQGDAYRIVFVHAPAAAMSVALYTALAACAIAVLAGAHGLPAAVARAIAPSGALMTFLALWTGSLWARPVRGLWWDWDLRFIAEVLLLALFLAVIALNVALDAQRRADRAVAWLVIASAPIMLALPWWARALPIGPGLHVGAAPPPPSDAPVRWALALMTAAFFAWTLAAVLHRLRTILIERERGADWVRELARRQP